jgi:hypothetical protein
LPGLRLVQFLGHVHTFRLEPSSANGFKAGKVPFRSTGYLKQAVTIESSIKTSMFRQTLARFSLDLAPDVLR